MLKNLFIFSLFLSNSISAYAFLPDLTFQPGQKFQRAIVHPYKIGELKNLKDITFALNGVDPNATDDADLASFGSLVGDATVVGLGESTHGTREFFQMKHRLLKYLVKHKGFTIFAIEGSMAQASLLNDYVLYGKGNSKELLKNLEGWVYNTKEVLSMINWMYEYNQSAKIKVQFAGFDSQDVNPLILSQLIQNAFRTIGDEKSAMEINQVGEGIKKNWNSLTDFLRFQRPIINKYDQLAEELKKKNLPTKELDRLMAILIDEKISELKKFADQYIPEMRNLSVLLSDNMTNIINEIKIKAGALAAKLGQRQYEWVLQNAYLMQQNIQFFLNLDDHGGLFQTLSLRDKAMAENIFWLQDHNPGAKIVIWAHDLHINNLESASDEQDNQPPLRFMGRHLKLKLGDHYRPVSLITYDGKYRAVKKEGGIGECNLQVPPDNAIEAIVNKLAMPFAMLNLKDKDNLPAFLHQPILIRFIGAGESSNQFVNEEVGKIFDGMIFIKDTTSAQESV